MKKPLLLLILLPALAFAQDIEYGTYDECILDRLAGISSDIAAQAIIKSCATVYSDSEVAASIVGGQENTEESLTTSINEEVANSQINGDDESEALNLPIGINEPKENITILSEKNIKTSDVNTTGIQIIQSENQLSESDIQILDDLKNQYLPNFSEKTIGELFDNYEHCEAKGWHVERTEEETVINYFCDIKIFSNSQYDVAEYPNIADIPRFIILQLEDIDESFLSKSSWSMLGAPINNALMENDSKESALFLTFKENKIQEVQVFIFKNAGDVGSCLNEFYESSIWQGYERAQRTATLFVKFTLNESLRADGKYSICWDFSQCVGHNVDGNTFVENQDGEVGILSEKFLNGMSENRNPSDFYYNIKIPNISEIEPKGIYNLSRMNEDPLIFALSNQLDEFYEALVIKLNSCSDSFFIFRE
jgi:hypothetical protein